jgi:hypothetical protein
MKKETTMNRRKPNTKTLLTLVFTVAVIGLVGCTGIQALTLDAETLSQQAAPAPAVRQSPSYYMDDPSVIQGSLPAPAPALRQSPSYYMDDTSVIQGAPVPATVELRFSPSYWRDDPTLVGLK